MRAVGSLRGRVAILATLAVGMVLLLVGTTSVASFGDRERARVDDGLRNRPVGALVRALSGRDFGIPQPGPPEPGDLGPQALRPEGEYVRLIAGDQVVRAVDAPASLPAAGGPGVRTLDADGGRYRSLTRAVEGGGLLEVGTDLGPADEQDRGPAQPPAPARRARPRGRGGACPGGWRASPCVRCGRSAAPPAA